MITTINNTAIIRNHRSEDFRKAHGGDITLVLFDNRDNYTAYGDSADQISQATGLGTSKTDFGFNMIQFRKVHEDIVFARCVKEGYKLAVISD